MITDAHLVDLIGKKLQHHWQTQGFQVELLSFPAGEVYKTRETKQQLEDTLMKTQYGRDTCLIALGGGVVTDLVGFLAATYCRGIPVIYIPTTLLAMVDASIGGKTGVNTPYGKNLIGTFTQPSAVFMDISLLETFPGREWHNGMAEIIKHSLIADPNLFNQLKNSSNKIKQRDPQFLVNMIYASCLIKKNIVEKDEYEKGLRQLLNLGHTIGHAIEAVEGYRISHGEAVAIGMLVECYLSVQLGYLPESVLKALHALLKDYDLPLSTSAFEDRERFQVGLILDKKSIQKIPRFVLLDKIGQPHCEESLYTSPVEPVYLNQALDWAAQTFGVKANVK